MDGNNPQQMYDDFLPRPRLSPPRRIRTSQTMTGQPADRYGCYTAAAGCHRDQRQSHIIIRSLARRCRKIFFFFAHPHFVFSIIVAKRSVFFLYRGAESGCQSRGGVGF